MNIFILVSLGILTGVLSGFFGIGGGVILVPGLIYLLHFAPQKAIAISLIVIIPTALTGAFKNLIIGNTDLNIAIPIAIGGAIGALIGTSLCDSFSSTTLSKAFGILLIGIGLSLLFGFHSSNTTLQ